MHCFANFRPAFLIIGRVHRDLRRRLPAAQHGDRPGRLRRQGRWLADRARRCRRRQRADRPDVHRAAVLPLPAVGGRRRLRRLGQLGSNLGPTNPDLLVAVEERAAAYRKENGLAADAMVPVDAVTASGSGLDPHISVANARLRSSASPTTRGLDVAVVEHAGRTSTPTAANSACSANRASMSSIEPRARRPRRHERMAVSHAHAARFASTSVPRRASARPTRCSARAAATSSGGRRCRRRRRDPRS